ncbi:MAG TPA: response regulator [Acetobacteraceae bacterium]|nr:response regulator [Acetobacteraceae bacterium]
MRSPPLILVADDNPANVEILEARLRSQGYDVITARDGEEAATAARRELPDLILLDVMMPKQDGYAVCRELKNDPSLPFMPIILVTARTDQRDIIAGLDSGGDEYVAKPVDQAALVARVRSLLRIKQLHDTVAEQSRQLAEWNSKLEERVAHQVAEIERMSRLRRFMAPQLADLVMSGRAELTLESHRREVAVVFADLRGFTAFAETAEPEEMIGMVREYHAALGEIVFRHEGTIERFLGDGLMVLLNDPVPCQEPALRAARMALEMQRAMADLSTRWRKLGHELGFGIGIAFGFATLGVIGFEARQDYTAMGTVANLAARLCNQAKSGETLLSQRTAVLLEGRIIADPVGPFSLKGISRPVTAYLLRAIPDTAA